MVAFIETYTEGGIFNYIEIKELLDLCLSADPDESVRPNFDIPTSADDYASEDPPSSIYCLMGSCLHNQIVAFMFSTND